VVKNEIRRRFVGDMKVLARNQQYEIWKDVEKDRLQSEVRRMPIKEILE